MNKKALVLKSLLNMILILFVIVVLVVSISKITSIGKSTVSSGFGFFDSILGSHNSPFKSVSFSVEDNNLVLKASLKDYFKGKIKTEVFVYTPNSVESSFKYSDTSSDFSLVDKDKSLKVTLNGVLSKFESHLFSKMVIQVRDESSSSGKVFYKETYFVIYPQVLNGVSIDKGKDFFRELLDPSLTEYSKKNIDTVFSVFSKSCYSKFSLSSATISNFCRLSPGNCVPKTDFVCCVKEVYNSEYLFQNMFTGRLSSTNVGFCEEIKYSCKGKYYLSDKYPVGCFDSQGHRAACPSNVDVNVFLKCDYGRIPDNLDANVLKTNDGDFIFIKKSW